MQLKELGCECVEWIQMDQNRVQQQDVVKMAMNLLLYREQITS